MAETPDEGPDPDLQEILRRMLEQGGRPDAAELAKAMGLPGGAAGLEQLMGRLRDAVQNADGTVDWSIATDQAVSAAGAGSTTPTDAQAAGVDRAFTVAGLWLDESSGFGALPDQPKALTRTQWIRATMPFWSQLAEPVATRIAESLTSVFTEQLPARSRGAHPRTPAGCSAASCGTIFAAQLGAVVGGLASEVVSGGDVGIPLLPDGQAAPAAAERRRLRRRASTSTSRRSPSTSRCASSPTPACSGTRAGCGWTSPAPIGDFSKDLSIDIDQVQSLRGGLRSDRHRAPARGVLLRRADPAEDRGAAGGARAGSRRCSPSSRAGSTSSRPTRRRGCRSRGRDRRDRAAPPRDRRPGRAGVRDARRPRAAAAPAARGRRDVAARHGRASASTAATRSGRTPTCCRPRRTSTTPTALVARLTGGERAAGRRRPRDRGPAPRRRPDPRRSDPPCLGAGTRPTRARGGADGACGQPLASRARGIIPGVLRIDPAAAARVARPATACRSASIRRSRCCSTCRPTAERLLAALVAGTTGGRSSGSPRTRGARRTELERPARAPRPALARPGRRARRRCRSTDRRTSRRSSASRWLGAGTRPTAAPRAPALVVVAAPPRARPRGSRARWLDGDVPHLAVVFGDTPRSSARSSCRAASPCLRCAEEHRLDDDPAWRAIAAQLLAARSGDRPASPARGRARRGRRARCDALRQVRGPAGASRAPPSGSPPTGRSAALDDPGTRACSCRFPAARGRSSARNRDGAPLPRPRCRRARTTTAAAGPRARVMPDVEQPPLLLDRRRRGGVADRQQPLARGRSGTRPATRGPSRACSVASGDRLTGGSCCAAARSASSATNACSVVTGGRLLGERAERVEQLPARALLPRARRRVVGVAELRGARRSPT